MIYPTQRMAHPVQLEQEISRLKAELAETNVTKEKYAASNRMLAKRNTEIAQELAEARAARDKKVQEYHDLFLELAKVNAERDLTQAKCAEVVDRAKRVIQIYDTQTISAPLGTGIPLDHLAIERLREAITKDNPGQPLLDRLAALERALKIIATDNWGPGGGRSIYGNDQLPGCEEFYRGYNGGVKVQFERTQKIAREALAACGSEVKNA